MSNYTSSEFEKDAEAVARSLHLAYRRSQYLLARWNAGMNTEFPNSGDTIPMNNLMNRVMELITDYDATGSAKLNTVMAKSNLQLPGDA